jgi:tubulin polyglutamylase TTLL6/13
MLGFKVIREATSEDWDLYWTDNAVSSEQLAKMKAHQKINHFPGMYTLSRKNYLARNLIKM